MQIKGQYPLSIPKYPNKIIEDDGVNYQNKVIGYVPEGIPVIVLVENGRIHVFNETNEIVYDPFDKTEINEAIRKIDKSLRNIKALRVFYGRVTKSKEFLIFAVWNRLNNFLDWRSVDSILQNYSLRGIKFTFDDEEKTLTKLDTEHIRASQINEGLHKISNVFGFEEDDPSQNGWLFEDNSVFPVGQVPHIYHTGEEK